MLLSARDLAAQSAIVSGRVTAATTSAPLGEVLVLIEGTTVLTHTDGTGSFVLRGVPPGIRYVKATRLGFAPARREIVVEAGSETHVDLRMAPSALNLRGVVVTADPGGRARGELGTASVIDREAIRNQMAASLAGVLELLPGVPLQAPGLDVVQQLSLRSVPVSPRAAAGPTAVNASAEQLAAFGTLIVLDGVPASNNANLQSLGPRGELSFASSAGGGIDLRRIPAATLERVEVIRGIPSARYGDLTEGAVIVDTRAGAVAPELLVRADAHTTEATVVGGIRAGLHHTLSMNANVVRTEVSPGLRDAASYRATAQLAHRFVFGGGQTDVEGVGARAVFDTRISAFRLYEDDPQTGVLADVASYSHDEGLQVSERARLRLGTTTLSATSAFDDLRQASYSQAPELRGATPFTDRLTPGRSIGHYVAGSYVARVHVDGDPRYLYARIEADRPTSLGGSRHELRIGSELRREWSSGPGYQFDIEFPPQVEFNGVQGYARPRRYDDIPAIATTALYADDDVLRAFAHGVTLETQIGARVDILHRGDLWLSGARDAAFEPRMNAELGVTSWLRFHGGAGRLAKIPSLGDLAPAPQYNDVVNVNWYANNPAERLAVLTTSIVDPRNPGLGYANLDRLEGGFSIDLFRAAVHADVTTYVDRLSQGAGIRAEPTFLVREHFQLTDSTTGTGRPPSIVEPASSQDTVPIIVDRRDNNLGMRGRGLEATVSTPEIPRTRTRFALQLAYQKSRTTEDGLAFATTFSDFQLTDSRLRAPYWQAVSRAGERILLTTRLIHQQPEVGLVITGTFQHTLREIRQDFGGADTLSWNGYITRAGVLVPVPTSARGDAQYADLRQPRIGLLIDPQGAPADWLFNLQVSKTMPLGGRLSFYAFNALDRVGVYGGGAIRPRLYASTRFGIELSAPLTSQR